jgi:hypothetical protein
VILLVSGATRYPRDERIGHLIVPGSWNDPAALGLQPDLWAMDNGAFGGGFDAGQYATMLEVFWAYRASGCLFVTVPDVIYKSGIGDAAATRKKWPFWSQVIRGLNFRPAFVAQDGLRQFDTPWDELGCLFIGGSTKFKESAFVRDLVLTAIYRGKWVHWGRVNGQRRLELIMKAMQGYPDWSFDGTGFSRWPDTNIPLVAEWVTAIDAQPELGL